MSWQKYSQEKELDMFSPKNTDIIQFLTGKFGEGLSYGSLNSMRAAISLISRNDLSKDLLLSRFFRGIFKKKPSKPRYSSTWDTEQVLNYIEQLDTLESLKLKELSEITVTLLILTTAHRLQTLSLIKIDNISVNSKGLKILIPDLIKTSKPGKDQPMLTIPFYRERKNLCVASAIILYQKVTEEFRTTSNKLFISTTKPHGPVSPQTISHWIKSLLKKADIDVAQFSGYSAKHASVSAAYRKGIDVSTIRRTAGWSDKSMTFAHYYNRPVQEPLDRFANAILSKS